MEIILTPFAWLLQIFYSFCNSYGLTLVLFALVVKVVLFPLSLKGKRSMIQMNILQGQMQKLQKQYGKDRQRYNLEVQKLYEKEKVNPMGGCLWSFIPLIILMVLYPIIRAPIHYMMGITDPNSLNAIAEAVNWSTHAVDMGWIKQAAASFTETAGYYNEGSSRPPPASLRLPATTMSSIWPPSSTPTTWLPSSRRSPPPAAWAPTCSPSTSASLVWWTCPRSPSSSSGPLPAAWACSCCR